MAVTGLGTKFAWLVEASWDAGGTPTDATQIMSESFKRNIERIEPQTLTAGNRMVTSAGWRPGATTSEGSVEMQLLDTGLEEWWRLALGGYSFAGTVHSFSPGAITKSMGIQIGMGGDTDGTPWKRFRGVVVDSWEFEATAGSTDAAKVTFDCVGGLATIGDTGAIPGAYPATVAPFTWLDVGTLTFAGGTFECVKGIKISGQNNLKTDRFCLGADTIADPRVETARREYDIVLTIDFEDWTLTPTWYTMFTAGTEGALNIVLTSGSKTMTITGNLRVDGETPMVDGTDLVEVDIPCKFVATAGDETGFQIDIDNGTTALPA